MKTSILKKVLLVAILFGCISISTLNAKNRIENGSLGAIISFPTISEPDLTVQVSTSTQFYAADSNIQIFYKISNVGNQNSIGPITLVVSVNADAGLISTTLPIGWSLQSRVGKVFTFVTQNGITSQDPQIIVMNYKSGGGSSATNTAQFVANLVTGSAGDYNNDNNTDSILLLKK